MDLQFESRFESGNLFSASRVQVPGDDQAQVYFCVIQPDENSGSHSQWFNFAIGSVRPNTVYTFALVNFVKRHSTYEREMRILVVPQGSGGKKCSWEGHNVMYKRNKDFMAHENIFRSLYTLIFQI